MFSPLNINLSVYCLFTWFNRKSVIHCARNLAFNSILNSRVDIYQSIYFLGLYLSVSVFMYLNLSVSLFLVSISIGKIISVSIFSLLYISVSLFSVSLSICKSIFRINICKSILRIYIWESSLYLSIYLYVLLSICIFVTQYCTTLHYTHLS